MAATATIRDAKTGQTIQVPVDQLSNYGINLNTAQLAQMQGIGQDGQTDLKQTLINSLPAVLGTAGAVGGEVVEPAGGGIVGGGVGSGFGEWLKEVFSGQQANPGEIAKQTGIGSLFGLIPGAEDVLGVGKAGADIAAGTGEDIARTSGNNFLSNLAANTAKRSGVGFGAGGLSAGINDIGSGKSPNQILSDVAQSGLTTAIANGIVMPGLGGIAKYLLKSAPEGLTRFVGKQNESISNSAASDIQDILNRDDSEAMRTAAENRITNNDVNLQNELRSSGLVGEDGLPEEGLTSKSADDLLGRSEDLQSILQEEKSSVIKGKTVSDTDPKNFPNGYSKDIYASLNSRDISPKSKFAKFVDSFFEKKSGSDSGSISYKRPEGVSIPTETIDYSKYNSQYKNMIDTLGAKTTPEDGKIFSEPNKLNLEQVEAFRKGLGKYTNFNTQRPLSQEEMAANEMYAKTQKLLEEGTGVDANLKALNKRISLHEKLQNNLRSIKDSSTPLNYKYSRAYMDKQQEIRDKAIADRLGLKPIVDVPGEAGKRMAEVRDATRKGDFAPLKQLVEDFKNSKLLKPEEYKYFQTLFDGMKIKGQHYPISPTMDAIITAIPILGYEALHGWIGAMFGHLIGSMFRRTESNPAAAASIDLGLANFLRGLGSKTDQLSGITNGNLIQSLGNRLTAPQSNMSSTPQLNQNQQQSNSILGSLGQ